MKDQLVGMLLVVESTGHEHYRTGHIAAAVGNCYLIQFDKMEESRRPRCRQWSCTRSRS